jgi:hypothetical protein
MGGVLVATGHAAQAADLAAPAPAAAAAPAADTPYVPIAHLGLPTIDGKVLGIPIGQDGKLTFGGSVRTRFDVNFNDLNSAGQPAVTRHAGLDTTTFDINYDSSSFFASGREYVYGGSYPYTQSAGYSGNYGDVNFVHHAYVGYKINGTDQVTAGIQQMPFGLEPYFSSTYLETVGFTNGTEEIMNVGAVYNHTETKYNYQIGYFPTKSPDFGGISVDGAHYSTNIGRADPGLVGGTNNDERNMLVARGEYLVFKTDTIGATIGGSVEHSWIYNYDTQETGSKQQEAIHFLGTYGGWALRAIAVRTDIDPRNPNGLDQTITINGYDASYNMATKGWTVSGELTYTWDPDKGPFSEIQPYVNYSNYLKDNGAFQDTERYIFGGVLTLRSISSVYIYPEFRLARNDPYTGAFSFSQGLAAGGDNRWDKAFTANVGYYF